MGSKTHDAGANDQDPLKFLIDRKEYHDWTVVVTDPHTKKQMVFGVLSANLAAHSSVFRTMMTDPKWVKENRLELTSMSPRTFVFIYRFVNGGGLPEMSRMEAADLALAADMYMMPRLVKKACKRLVPEKVEEVFEPLMVVSFIPDSELKPHVLNLVQRNTSEIMTSNAFLDLDRLCVEFIVRQETLSLMEKDIWKNVVKWAKHQVFMDGKKTLRSALGGVLKHIRFCTLTQQDIAMEVATTNVLNGDELAALFCAVISNQPWDWTGLCNSRTKRQLPKPEDTVQVFKVNERNCSRSISTNSTNTSWFTIMAVKNIELKSLVFQLKQRQNLLYSYRHSNQTQGSHSVRLVDSNNREKLFNFEGPKNKMYTLTLSDSNNESVLLEANQRYSIKVDLSPAQIGEMCFETNENNHSMFLCEQAGYQVGTLQQAVLHTLNQARYNVPGGMPFRQQQGMGRSLYDHQLLDIFQPQDNNPPRQQGDIITVEHQSPVCVAEIHYKVLS